MTPAQFRRDPWLRTSASHLATWSFAALVLETFLHSTHANSTRVAMSVAVVVASLMASMTTERRIAKMVGPAGDAVYEAAGRMWRIVLSLLSLATVALVATSQGAMITPLWLAGVGATFVWWGRKADFAWYVMLGAMMVAASVGASSSASAGVFRMVVLGVLLPVAAIATNRQSLWLRAED